MMWQYESAQAADNTAFETAVLPRSQIPAQDKWNVEALYRTLGDWEAEYNQWAIPTGELWQSYSKYQGTLQNGVKNIKECLDKGFLLSRYLNKLYVYAHLCHDEDIAAKEAKVAYEKARSALFAFREKTSWFEPEILSLPDEYLKQVVNDTSLKEYKVYLESIIRMKPHILSGEKEALLSLSAQALSAPSKVFSAFTNADLRFSPVADSQGKSYELTLGSYSKLLYSSDRQLRKNAFTSLHKTFMSYENSLTEMLSAQVQAHIFDAKTHNYTSSLQAALFPNQIDESVYRNLIQSVRQKLPSLHRYIALRKKMLGVSELHCYDLYVPLVQQADIKMPYHEAEAVVIEASSFLGKEYQSDLKKGLLNDRWVDRYENLRKRSGAYSSGCFDSMPYILMNYHGTLRDVMTLCHESGHSMHSLLSRRHQPYQYSDYPIFVAEVASTFFEEVLMRHLIKNAQSKEHKAYLINQKIEDIRATLFRQTMFAEFELFIHEMAEQGIPLTPDLLKKEYHKLNEEYYGKDLVVDSELDIEWARIPHFYYNFYVYQYATGISAALSLVNKVEREGEKARKDYLTFLSSGSSKFPLDLLKIAGVDMRKPDAVDDTIDYFEKLVDELEKLLK